MRRCARPVVFAIVAALGAWAAWGQNLDEGKTASQLFEADCSACHKGPQGLGKNASVGFLRQHYTSSAQSASLLAAYLASAASNPRGERKRVGTGDEKGGTAEERETRANRKTREKTAVARPPEEKTSADRRKERKSKRRGAPEPATSQPAGAPASQPPATATAPAPAPAEGQTAVAPSPATPSGEAPAASPNTAAAPPAPSGAPAVAAANPPPAGGTNPPPASPPSPSRVADQPVFSTPLP